MLESLERAGRGALPASPDLILDQLCVTSGTIPLRAMVIVAHPDDETIGAGGRLARFQSCRIVHLTDGAPFDATTPAEDAALARTELRGERRRELLTALSLAGVSPDGVQSLAWEDQHTTLGLANLTRTLARLINTVHPDVILTHPYEGGHPDHDATAFAVQAAAAVLAATGEQAAPLVEMAFYHSINGVLRTGAFLPGGLAATRTSRLEPADRTLKGDMLACFSTQNDFLSLFDVEHERFRLAPAYDFLRPPHDGVLRYELQARGWNGERWRVLAREAVTTLGLPPPPWPVSTPPRVA